MPRTTKTRTRGYRPHVRRVERVQDPACALVALSSEPRPVLLHSAGGAPARFSLLGFAPREVVELAPPAAAAWAELARVLDGLAAWAPTERLPGPFQGGFLGALSYDLHAPGARLDLPADLPAEPFAQPLVVGGIYTDFLVWEHDAERCFLVLDDDDTRPAREARLLAALAEECPAPRAPGGHFRRATSAPAHRRGVEAVRAQIEAGEIYQANLSHRLVGRLPGDPRDAYRSLIAANPVPFAGYIGWPGGALLSASPELLFEVDADVPGEPRRVRTRPIKGTAPRSTDPERDAALGAALLVSAKDRAELAMIVDLERNDLGRVARLGPGGGARVDTEARLERYASVQHLVADVSAELAPGVTPVELLGALFPGGSITGAPKLRSMEVIAALEGAGRGFFTGSLGFVDTRGAAAFNILIRSLLWQASGDVSLRVGGGVTWASDPRAEDEETLHKAASLLAGLGAGLDPRR